MIDILVTAPAQSGLRTCEPIRVGVPLPRSCASTTDTLSLQAASGEGQPAQFRILDRWGDGSIRWLLVDFQASHSGERPHLYRLNTADSAPAIQLPHATAAGVSDGLVTVETGVARFRIRHGSPFPFEDMEVAGLEPIGQPVTTATVEAKDGGSHLLVVERTAVEDAGPLRAVIRVEGSSRGSTDPLGYIAQLHFFAGSPVVRVELTLHNPRAAHHPGGIWELGDANAILLRDVSFTVAIGGRDTAARLRVSPDVGQPLAQAEDSFELFQASSGGANWSSRNHVNRHGKVPLAFGGYRLRAGGHEARGRRATPVASLTRGNRQVAIAMPQFWQNFPKAIEGTTNSLTLRLFPRQHGDLHELQPGEQKTHVFHVAFSRDPVCGDPLEWIRAPLFARATPAQYCLTGAVPYVLPLSDDPHREYAALVSAAVDGDDTFERKRETADEYGWRNFGDLYADHEIVHCDSPRPVVSHYNNQYDGVGGCALQFMRSGDSRWWAQMNDLAMHVVDIDMYHTDGDRSAYDRGLFWHTAHYTDAGRSTHRSYPGAPGVNGGGPSNEHNYSTGLLLHYFLTGDVRSRDAALDLARWVVDMDDGSKRVFRWLAGGDSGLASATRSPDYHGPGRGAGNSIAVLLNAFTLGADRAFLEKAEALIRRCIHHRDDIAARDLLNAELRWSYTVFLHGLGRYLDLKVDLDEIDGNYAYARAALLAYARWMVTHERPYLSRPEELEYPTETWAAQEIWKSEVLLYAAKYGSVDERAAFLDRAGFFFRYAVDYLGQAATRTLTRPMVLLLSHGLMNGFAAVLPDMLTAPAGPPVPIDSPLAAFVPQRRRAVKRLQALMVAGAAAVAALAALVLWSYLMGG